MYVRDNRHFISEDRIIDERVGVVKLEHVPSLDIVDPANGDGDILFGNDSRAWKFANSSGTGHCRIGV